MKKILVFSALFATLSALAADFVTSVTARQRWPFSRLVDVTYVMAGATETMDIEVSFVSGSEKIPVPTAAIDGQVYDVANGTHTLVVDPTACGVSRELLTAAKVEVRTVESPVYLIADLRQTLPAGAKRLTYLTKSDIRTGAYGTYAEGDGVDWIQNCSLPSKFVWTGVTNNNAYYTTHIVFRRIPAGACRVPNSGGTLSSTNNLFITKPYYVGVFEWLAAQENVVTGQSIPTIWCDGTKPYGNVAVNYMRGATNATEGVNWPATGYDKVAGRAKTLRDRLGVKVDQLTGGQWMLAYRAGTESDYYVGYDVGPYTVGNTNTVVGTIARYQYNGGWSWNEDHSKFSWNWNTPAAKSDPNVGWAVAGMYRPNAYGLYDMAGNVDEVVLDYYCAFSSAFGDTRRGTDPVGPTYAQSVSVNSGKRCAMGGSAWAGFGSLKYSSTGTIGCGEGSSMTGTRYGIVIDHR